MVLLRDEKLFRFLSDPLVFTLFNSVCVIVAIYASTKMFSFLRILIRTFTRDIRALSNLIRGKIKIAYLKYKDKTVAKNFRDQVKNEPNRIIFYFEDDIWTVERLEKFSNQIANVFRNQGFKRGDDVALFMESKPEYVGIWLGLSKIGVVPGLINTNQKQGGLVHSITTINSKAVIYGTELADQVNEVKSNLKSIEYFYFEKSSNRTSSVPDGHDLNKLLKETSDEEPKEIEDGHFNDKLLYLYTSGTTGLPKAAIITNSRYQYVSTTSNNFIGFRGNQVIYTPIPIYHMAGGMLGVGIALLERGTLVIRSHFSARNFWSDCRKYSCNSAQYIGEICRYLLAQPSTPADKDHRVTHFFGNGLRPVVWSQFQERFGVKKIVEFYGSTEGNAHMCNNTNKVGACGHLAGVFPYALLKLFYPVCCIKVDPETQDIIRNRKGWCIQCKKDEIGEIIGKITDGAANRVDGYINKEATERKIIRDVFVKGDVYFRTGDLFTTDELGYFYFVDRTGDTFRWKGENVSTLEIESTISNILDLSDSVVYGVEIPGCEGRAGMAAITDPERRVNLKMLLDEMKKLLPSYAIPIFIRLTNSIRLTSTFKLQKTSFKREGFDPRSSKDSFYVIDDKRSNYKLLSFELYMDILNSQVAF